MTQCINFESVTTEMLTKLSLTSSWQQHSWEKKLPSYMWILLDRNWCIPDSVGLRVGSTSPSGGRYGSAKKFVGHMFDYAGVDIKPTCIITKFSSHMFSCTQRNFVEGNEKADLWLGGPCPSTPFSSHPNLGLTIFSAAFFVLYFSASSAVLNNLTFSVPQ